MPIDQTSHDCDGGTGRNRWRPASTSVECPVHDPNEQDGQSRECREPRRDRNQKRIAGAPGTGTVGEPPQPEPPEEWDSDHEQGQWSSQDFRQTDVAGDDLTGTQHGVEARKQPPGGARWGKRQAEKRSCQLAKLVEFLRRPAESLMEEPGSAESRDVGQSRELEVGHAESPRQYADGPDRHHRHRHGVDDCQIELAGRSCQVGGRPLHRDP